MNEKLTQTFDNDTSTGWGSFETVADLATLQAEKSKELYLRTKERDIAIDEAWDKLDDSQKSYFNANRLRTADLLIREARNQDQSEGNLQEIAFTDEQMNGVKQLNGSLRNLLRAHGANAEVVKDFSLKNSVADAVGQAMSGWREFGVGITPDSLKNVLDQISPIVLSLNEQNGHLGTRQMSTKAIEKILSSEENAIRRLKPEESKV